MNRIDKPDWTNRTAMLIFFLVLLTYVWFVIEMWSRDG